MLKLRYDRLLSCTAVERYAQRMSDAPFDPRRRIFIGKSAAQLLVPVASGLSQSVQSPTTEYTSIPMGQGIRASDLGLQPASKPRAAGDQSVQFQRAFDLARQHPNVPLLLEPGYYSLGRSVSFRGGILLAGAGSDATFIHALGDGFRMLSVDPDASGEETVGLRGLTLHGNLDRNPGSADNLTQIGRSDRTGFARAILEDIHVTQAQGMGLVVFAREISANRLRVSRTYRDGIHFGYCERAIIRDVEVLMCGDDALAVHLKPDSAGTAPADRQILIDGVRLEKSLGIKVLGLRNGIIRNVLSRFATAYTVYIGLDPVTREGSSEYDCLVDGVIAWDTINGAHLGLGPLGAGVVLALPDASDGGKNVSNASSTPDSAINSERPANTTSPSEGITISNVKLRQTLSGLGSFADACFGLLWQTGKGDTDPQLRATIALHDQTNAVDAIAVLSGALRSITLRDIQCVGGRNGIWFGPQVTQLECVQINGGHFERLSRAAVAMDPSGLVRNGNSSVGLTVRGGVYNLDPFTEATGHQPDGRWRGGDPTDQVGFFLPNLQGISIEGVTMKNTRRLVHHAPAHKAADGAYFPVTATDVWNVTWEGDPMRLSGNGELLDWSRNRLRWIDGDPRSPTFGQYLGGGFDGLDRLSRPQMPADGKWAKGEFVRNSAASATLPDNRQNLLRGWLRLTTGEGHVFGSDWIPIQDPAKGYY